MPYIAGTVNNTAPAFLMPIFGKEVVINMGCDYFYGVQADQFTFYRVPKLFFIQEQYQNMSTDAKLLYGMLLDRMNLSARNGWLDEQGRVYIIYPIDEIMSDMGCADNKATKILDDLEKRFGLIERKRQGLGKPNLIYVKNFVTGCTGPPEQRFLNRENHDSGVAEITIQEAPKSRCNNTDMNNTENNDIDSLLSGNPETTDGIKRSDTMDAMNIHTQYREYFEESLSLPVYRQRFPLKAEMIDEIRDLLTDACSSKAATIRIGGDEKPAEVVKGRFMKLDCTHLEYVLDCLENNTTEIRNIKQYLLTTLYNATMTIDSYYSALVKHDMSSR